MISSRTVVIAMALVGSCAGARVAQAQQGMLPQDLAAIARQLSCEPVSDFYSRPGVVEPPYVYGVNGEDMEASAVFWCQRPASEIYLLVVWRAKAARSMTEWANFPGGLSITPSQDWSLAEFRKVGEPQTHGPAIVLRSKRAIHSRYDGVSEIFIEYNGTWYVKMID
jgi:hypothetical protein